MLSASEFAQLLKGNTKFWIERVLNFAAAFSGTFLLTSPFLTVRYFALPVFVVTGPFSVSLFLTNSFVAPVLTLFRFRTVTRVHDEDFEALVRQAKAKVRPMLRMVKGLDNASSNRLKRSISYGEVLYSRQTRTQRLAVMAHEIGHLMRTGFSKRSAFLLGDTFFVGFILSTFTQSVMLIDLIVVSLLSTVAVSFRWDMEYAADDYACSVVGPLAVIEALEGLASSSKHSLISETHPSIKKRVQRIKKNWHISKESSEASFSDSVVELMAQTKEIPGKSISSSFL